MEPVGFDSCQYHDYCITVKKETALQACISDEETDKITRGWLSETLTTLYGPKRRRNDKVLEVMAGYGRNVPVLQEKFNPIELLDGSKEMIKEA